MISVASFLPIPPDAAVAKCKKKCGPCKRCKKGKCKPKPNGTTCHGGACQGGACVADAVPQPSPPLPPAPPTGPGRCDAANAADIVGDLALAQTFLPPRSGQMTEAAIFLRRNPLNFSLTFEIRTVDGTGDSSSTILASATVNNIPETSGDTVRRVAATFSNPAPINLGQQYALVIEPPDIVDNTYGIQFNDGGNPCPDGTLFLGDPASGQFWVPRDGNDDLVYDVTIRN